MVFYGINCCVAILSSVYFHGIGSGSGIILNVQDAMHTGMSIPKTFFDAILLAPAGDMAILASHCLVWRECGAGDAAS